MQNLLSKDLKVKAEIVSDKSLCRYKSNNYRSLSVPDLVNVLQCFHKRSALVYYQRNRRPDIFELVLEFEKDKFIELLSIVQGFFPRKQNNSDLLNQFK